MQDKELYQHIIGLASPWSVAVYFPQVLGAVSERPFRQVSGFARFGLVAKRNQNGDDAQSQVRAAEAREEPPESGLRRPHAMRGCIWGTYANCPFRSSIETGGWVRRTEN